MPNVCQETAQQANVTNHLCSDPVLDQTNVEPTCIVIPRTALVTMLQFKVNFAVSFNLTGQTFHVLVVSLVSEQTMQPQDALLMPTLVKLAQIQLVQTFTTTHSVHHQQFHQLVLQDVSTVFAQLSHQDKQEKLVTQLIFVHQH
jgi:hypothetical protein